MSKITVYLDDSTQAQVERAANAKGISKSRWVGQVIRKYTAEEWPEDCLDLAGRFADFPLRTENLGSSPADGPRLGF